MTETRKPRVLIVDDTEGNRYATSRILHRAGFDVAEAATGREALARIRDDLDVVVLDINLPDMTGFEVVERMRRLPAQAGIPVLHLTASYTTELDEARGLAVGADAYLTHPIDPVVFVATVRALARSRVADRRLQDAALEWQATFDALAAAVFLLDERAVVQRVNHAACALLGREDHDLLAQPVGLLLAGVFAGESAAIVKRVAEHEPLDKEIVVLGGRTYAASTRPVQTDEATARTVLVLDDVSERVAAERERETLLAVAEEARFEAERANRAKSEFLAVMSHELRTPLNAIGGYAQLIELGIRGPVTEPQRADLDRIKRSQTYLLSLINDVLNFAKIEGGQVHVSLQAVSLGDVIDGMRDFVQPQLRELGLSYACASCDPDLLILADQERVQQILLNLLSNALKFTPSGGEIHVSCVRDGAFAVVRIRDTGLGIAAEKLEAVFEPFVQVDQRYKRQQEGIGLGLAISRELARAMHGQLTVTSEEGVGSTFELRLPLADMAS